MRLPYSLFKLRYSKELLLLLFAFFFNNRPAPNIDPDCYFLFRLKAALARRTGRSEEELCFEERRRSARVAEEENLSMEESSLIVERGNRRGRKEEPKLSDVRICSGDSS